MSAAGTEVEKVPAGSSRVPDREKWPQRLYLLADTAALLACADREAADARFKDLMARFPAETLEACPLQDGAGSADLSQDGAGSADLLPLFELATLTPALFLSLLAKCTTGKSRAYLQKYADDEARFARFRGAGGDPDDPKQLRASYDDAVFYCPDIEAFALLTGLTVVLHPAQGWYGSRTFPGTHEHMLELEHDFGSGEWSAELNLRFPFGL